MYAMTSQYSKPSTIQKFYPQWLIEIGVTVVILKLSIICSWASHHLTHLIVPDLPLPPTFDKTAWESSLLNLGYFLGSVNGVVSVNYLGSKLFLLLSGVPICLSWIITMMAQSCFWLYVAKAVGGLGLGMAYSCIALYVVELALPKARGALISLAISGGGSAGVLVSSICGSYFLINISAVAYLIISILVSIIFIWLPETHNRLVKIADYQSANHHQIPWYQSSINSSKNLEIEKNLVTPDISEISNDKVENINFTPIKRAILLIVIVSSLIQVTGLNNILFYMETILTRSKITLIDPSSVSICVNALGILATVMSTYLIDKSGRKLLLIISSVGVAVAMAGFNAHSYLLNYSADAAKVEWLPMASVFVFIVAYYSGLISVSSAVLCEIFPSVIM